MLIDYGITFDWTHCSIKEYNRAKNDYQNNTLNSNPLYGYISAGKLCFQLIMHEKEGKTKVQLKFHVFLKDHDLCGNGEFARTFTDSYRYFKKYAEKKFTEFVVKNDLLNEAREEQIV